MVTVCPAFTLDLAKALPTFPEPMIAIFMDPPLQRRLPSRSRRALHASDNTSRPMRGLDWKPARLPQRVPLKGVTAVLEPVDPPHHASALYSSSDHAPELWTHLAYGPF